MLSSLCRRQPLPPSPLRFSPGLSTRALSAISIKKPVLIAGAGPVGLSLSALLSRYGVPNVVLEKNSGLSPHPQAHFINCRTMELFRHAFPPVLSQRVKECVPPRRCWQHFIYATSVLNGTEIGRVNHFPSSSTRPPADTSPAPHVLLDQQSPTGVMHLSQSRLMPLLYDEAVAAAGRKWNGSGDGSTQSQVLRFGCEVTRFKETSDGPGVQLFVSEKASGQSHVLEGSYLVAADGASSCLRTQAQIHMRGESGIQHLMNVHFSSRALAQATEHRPAMLYFLYNARVICVLVAHHFPTGEFVAQVPFFPPVQTPDDFDAETVRDLVDAAIGQALPDLTVHSARPWTMDCQVADHYRAGRVLLAGDAAHRFPPAGGFGMNTGIQDAHNLAWKLALVLQGHADDTLLDTYEAERRPVAEHNADLSMRNYARSLRVPQALGLDAEQAKSLTRATATMPVPVPKAVVESMLALGRRPLRSLEEVGQPYGATCLAKARKVLEDGAGLPLLFPQDDLGFRYPPMRCGRVEGDRQRGGTDLDEVQVGGRLPHIWLECVHPTTGALLGKVSTTDLVDQLHVALTSLEPASPFPSSPFAILFSSSRTGFNLGCTSRLHWKGGEMPLVQVQIVPTPPASAPPSSAPKVTFADLPRQDKEALWRQIIEVGQLQLRDEDGQWERRVNGVGTDVLLRPDGHIWAITRGEEELDKGEEGFRIVKGRGK